MFLNETMLIVISIDQINVFSWELSSVRFFLFCRVFVYYTPVSKNCNDEQREYQPNVLPDQLIEKNHEACAYPKTIKLMNCNKTMKCCKVIIILRYRVPNKDIYPEKFAHHLLFMSYPL